MTVAVTGHRPQALGGYRSQPQLEDFAVTVLQHATPDHVDLGMALGWDTAVAIACVRLGIPFTAAIPFKGQESIWPAESQRTYHNLLEQATKVVIVCKGGFAAWKLQRRNEWMCDDSTGLLALYNGSGHGGTYNCIKYAESKFLPTANVWDEWIQFRNKHI